MLVFVDESGDTGFKSGASGQFTLTLIIFTENKEAEAASLAIDELRDTLRLTQNAEFHFNKSSKSHRKAFLQAVSGFEFSVFSAVVNKAQITSEGINNKESFYKFVCTLAFEEAKDYLIEANVTLDSSGDLNFKRQIVKHLKKQANEEGASVQRIKSVGMKPSHSDNLLQLADMVCGAVARAHRLGEKQSDSFHKIIKHREVSVLMWPQ